MLLSFTSYIFIHDLLALPIKFVLDVRQDKILGVRSNSVNERLPWPVSLNRHIRGYRES